MSSLPRNKKLVAMFVVTFLASVACLGGGSTATEDTGGESPDLAATQASLEATQTAVAQQPDSSGDTGDAGDTGDTGDSGDTSGDVDLSNVSSGDVLYETEFSGPGDWEDGWVHFPVPDSKEDYQVFIENDYLFFQITDTDATVYALYDGLYLPRDNADVLVETYFDNVGDVRTNNISVICRATDDGWYEFSVGSDGLWYIWKYTFDDGYTSLKNGGVPGYNRNVTDHTISATCIGDQFNFFFDGVELRGAQTHDSQFREGSTGVSVSTFDLSGVEVEFHEFAVSVP